jgi:hypothetical protein
MGRSYHAAAPALERNLHRRHLPNSPLALHVQDHQRVGVEDHHVLDALRQVEVWTIELKR